MMILLVAALGISLYLSYVELADKESVCLEGEVFDCNAVQTHSTSKILGFPVAYGGVIANVVLLGMLLLENRIPLLEESGVTLVFLAVLFGVMFSIYLIYLQAFVIEAYCIWCLTHEAMITLLFGLSAWRLRKSLMGQPA